MRALASLIAFIAATACALWLGFVAVPMEDALALVRQWGYWAVAVTVIVAAAGLLTVFRAEVAGGVRGISTWRGPRWWLAPVVLAACLLFALTREESGFKIVMDEPILVATSQAMYENRVLFTPTRAYNYEGAFTLVDGFIDKRPNLFPFLLSLLHDVSGYRVENVFVLNALLGGVLLAMVYFFGAATGARWVGLWGMLALTALPLFITNVNGGGFETLNLVMIMALLLTGARCLRQPDEAGVAAVVLVSMLLVQVRYESVLYLLAGGLIIGVAWLKARKIIFSPWLIPLPLLLVPWLWQYKTFSQREGFWQMDDFEGIVRPFSLDYVADNFAHAINFFFLPDRGMPNLVLLAIAGSIALAAMVVRLLLKIRSFRSWSVAEQVFLLSVAGFAANWVLVMVYFYGQLDLPIIHRLALPFYLLFVLALMVALARVAADRWNGARAAWIGLAVLFFVETLPKTAAQIYRQEYLAGREMAAVIDYIKGHEGEDYFVLSENAMVWIIHRVPALSFGRANLQPGRVRWFMEQSVSPEVLVHERTLFNPNTGEFVPQGKELLSPLFKRSAIERWHFTPAWGACISRLDAVEAPLPKAPSEFPTERDWIEYYYGRLP